MIEDVPSKVMERVIRRMSRMPSVRHDARLPGLMFSMARGIVTDHLTNLTSIWALKLAGSSAVRLLSGAGGDEDGIVLTEGGPAFTGSNYPINIVWVHGFYALFVPIEEAIARLDGIDNSLVI